VESGKRATDRAIYGTILATALIATLSEEPGASPGEIAIAVAGTGVVFWLVHAYATVLTGSIRPSWDAVEAGLARELPLLEGALVPALPLLLAPLAVLSDDTAEWLALGVGMGVLVLEGIALGRRAGYGGFGVALTGVINFGIGLAVVSLKAVVH
jgi:hypothetical protein